MLIANLLFNIANRITLKLKKNYEVEEHRSIIFRFLAERGCI